MERLSGHNPFIQPTLQHLEVGHIHHLSWCILNTL
jgi:hypothetical protein